MSQRGHDDEVALTEMMNIHSAAAEAVRQEYIEEPTKRNSMFAKAPDTHKEIREVVMSHTTCLIKIFVAMLALGFNTVAFKEIYENYRHSLWEDIYGRGVVFFACSCIQYYFQN